MGLNIAVGTVEITKARGMVWGSILAATRATQQGADALPTPAPGRHPAPRTGGQGAQGDEVTPPRLPSGLALPLLPVLPKVGSAFLSDGPSNILILPKSWARFPVCYTGTCWQRHGQKQISYCRAKQISLIMTQGVQHFISLSLTLSPSLWV